MIDHPALYRNKNSLAEGAKKEEHIKGVFTEQQRKLIRKKLNSFAKKKTNTHPSEASAPSKKKKGNEVPLLIDQTFHREFDFLSYNPALDEIPYLLLFRVYFKPYVENSVSLPLEHLRLLAERSGVEGTVLEALNNTQLKLSGEIARGGSIKFVNFHLVKCFTNGSEHVLIKNIIFKCA